MSIFKFPVLPTNGRHLWTRTTIARTGGATALYNFLNPQIRSVPGTSTTPFSASAPPTIWHGSHVIWNDNLYVTAQVEGSSSGYANRKLAYIQRINLRDTTDQEYIALPYSQGGYWCRGHDAVHGSVITDSTPTSINEFRDMQNIGHLLILGVPSDNYQVTDPFVMVYDTTRRTWTLGETWQQMRVKEPTLPLHPNLTSGGTTYFTLKGRNVAVPETGEWWTTVAGGNGIVKYRII
jgi:hypothetical protein